MSHKDPASSPLTSWNSNSEDPYWNNNQENETQDNAHNPLENSVSDLHPSQRPEASSESSDVDMDMLNDDGRPVRPRSISHSPDEDDDNMMKEDPDIEDLTPIEVRAALQNTLLPNHEVDSFTVSCARRLLHGTIRTIERPIKDAALSLVSTLPTTKYNDEEDHGERTSTYNLVQLQVLRYLSRFAADKVSDFMVRAWTEQLDPSHIGQPPAAVALRFCYYLRSRGFDTVAFVRAGTICLFLVTLNEELRYEASVYWTQEIASGLVREHVRAVFPQHRVLGQERGETGFDERYVQLNGADGSETSINVEYLAFLYGM